MPTQILSTPPECIANENRNKLRTFTKFTAQQSQKSWKRVKIVCKNTFSKLGTPFGLASVRFNPSGGTAAGETYKSIVSSLSSASAELPIKTLQVPTKKDDNDDDIISTGTNKLLLDTPKLSEESKDVLKKGPGVVSHPLPPPPPPPTAKKDIKKHEDKKENDVTMKKTNETFCFDGFDFGEKDSNNNEEKEGEEGGEKHDSDVIKYMKDVVLSISGIANPERSKIRSIVIDHGGKYTNDM